MTKNSIVKWIGRLTVMPLLVVIAALSFGVRFGEFVQGVPSVSPAYTAQAVEVDAPEMPEQKELMSKTAKESEAMMEALDSEMEKKSTNGSLPKPPEMTDNAESVDWRDADDSEFEFSEVRMELFEDLSKRRKDLADRDRELAVREALLKAAEQEISQKYKELVSLRSEIQDLLKEQTEEEQKRIASLVKIYEGMKPKDAARIFNTLDLDILLRVVSKMSERKSAPILASMNPDRARTLTMMLIEQRSLVEMSDNLLQ